MDLDTASTVAALHALLHGGGGERASLDIGGTEVGGEKTAGGVAASDGGESRGGCEPCPGPRPSQPPVSLAHARQLPSSGGDGGGAARRRPRKTGTLDESACPTAPPPPALPSPQVPLDAPLRQKQFADPDFRIWHFKVGKS